VGKETTFFSGFSPRSCGQYHHFPSSCVFPLHCDQGVIVFLFISIYFGCKLNQFSYFRIG